MGRQWVTPEEVKEYTDFKEVQERKDKKISVDIIRAENYVIKYTNNNFDSKNKEGNYLPLPDNVRTAIILIAEAYAYNEIIKMQQGDKKAETFDDYSYTLGQKTEIDFATLELDSLLEDYIIKKSSGSILMRLRAL